MASATITKATASKPAPNVPFYTPIQEPPSGTALSLANSASADHVTYASGCSKIPTLFHPLKIRSVTLPNRFIVSPMCQYSADDGHMTDWHLVHLGGMSMRGAGLALTEATAVMPNGRISPEDAGLWCDSQVAPLRRVVDFVHSQGHLMGAQLNHAGRKASMLAPWHGRRGLSPAATVDEGGWPDNVWGPSAIRLQETHPPVREMTREQIAEVTDAFTAAARRAVEAGVDVVEIHAAHGYLLTQFLSPLSNQRTDDYGGSFENRIRLLVEVIKAVRGVIPDTMPLFVRISATEWMEWTEKETWDLQQSIRLAHLLPDLGVDLLEVSSGGNHDKQKIQIHPYYQVDLAGQIRASIRKSGQQLLIGAVGLITTAEMARDIVQNTCQYLDEDPEKGCWESDSRGRAKILTEREDRSKADVVSVARQFLREPEFVLRVAQNLGVRVKWPNQFTRSEWREWEHV